MRRGSGLGKLKSPELFNSGDILIEEVKVSE